MLAGFPFGAFEFNPLAITGQPAFDWFFTIAVVFGVVSAVANEILRFFRSDRF